jgi:glycine oxidase
VSATKLNVTVVGAGIVGLWQAVELAYRGHTVDLFERTATPFSNAASQYAGAMLAPYCERDGGDPLVQELGLRGLERWKRLVPGVVAGGTLVVALPRDRSELVRFAERTQGHRRIDGADFANLEPDLADRFGQGLYFASEAHLEPAGALAFLLDRARRLGVRVHLGTSAALGGTDCVIDCRGLAARNDLVSLRGVRGERAVVQSMDVNLSRTVRLLHPRCPIYVVPWGADTYMLGATVEESEDAGPVSVRSTLDLLGLAYALHPAFGDARVVSLDAGIRPAFADNIPKIVVRDRHIFVNGLYRHGFLLAPVLAEMVADHLEQRPHDRRLLLEGDAAMRA